ncbi:UxaA family hydrolase [Metabacillus arenae]|uniref:Altronate dehydratase n=1 Tax=Metabacillus arenae TaxID=2771434 RepID=A0A926NKY5_9BACI|nr:altronate dehydratase family protein [Metabacillus arenae]MBD1383276.1 altronate dehydratase [Metabacillus arenae]
MSANYLIINANDNVLVALKNFTKGEKVEVKDRIIEVSEDVSFGHKIALTQIPQDQDVMKFGFPIGKAKKDIAVGEWVHTHNVATKLEGALEYKYEQQPKNVVKASSTNRTFKGYVRKNGDVGIRNEIWIINTVGCINKIAERIATTADKMHKGDQIDGVYHYPHPFGCSQLGDDLTNTQKILKNLVNHPNAAGVLVLGLGCENNNIPEFKKVIGNYDQNRVKFLAAQGVDDEIEAGLAAIEELVEYASTFKRKDVLLSKLKVGLKCGGSDGLSGITANPLLGSFSDRLISEGGTTVLTEVPEFFGAEQLLMERTADEGVFNATVELVNDFKEYFIRHGQVVYENPSPGNKDGGITTLEEKSLGNVQKGGFGEVVDVLEYGGKMENSGLNLLQGPGNDLVSVTNMAAAGAHIVLFTTGRGTPFGGPVPTVKISTNNSLFERKSNWIDFNAGELVVDKDMETMTDEFFDYIIQLASGETQAKNEKYGFKEIAIFKDGVML